jgi:predicted membrane-bound mannosyltransferase
VKSYKTKPLFTDKQVEDRGITPAESDSGDRTPAGQVSHANESIATSDTENEVSPVEDEIEAQNAEPDSYEEAGACERPGRRRFLTPPPTREQLLYGASFWGIILLGAILRFWGLGDKPLHHDESLHAYFSLQLMHNLEHWATCFNPPPGYACYQYDPLLHGPFQFHIIALVYKISQWLGVYDNGVNTFTVRIPAAVLGTVIVGLPYFLRDYLGKYGALIASFLLAVSPSMVYFSRFAREDIYMACFTLLMVVAVARYVRDRKMYWLVLAAAAFALAYATKEATFLSIAIFGSFMGGLIAWELGSRWRLPWKSNADLPASTLLPRTAAPLFLLGYFVIAGLAARFLFAWMKATSIYVTTHQKLSDIYVQGLKDKTVMIVPYLGIILGVYVLSILIRELLGKLPPQRRHGLAAFIDPKKQPLLDTILTMPWTHWFFAVLSAWTIFLVLFTVVFTNIRGGIGDGIWSGLYYWLEQQQVARGGQPWYYYLLLIPLYEQIGVVFGLVGLVRCLVRPTRFRLFIAYWFVGNVAIYSWAAEKMPWLVIHMTMPMMLLAAVGLEPIVMTLVNLVRHRLASRALVKEATDTANGQPVLAPLPQPRRVGAFAGSTAIVAALLALLLLLPTLHNMYEVAYIHPADGPHEMMVYVQTTTDVNIVMQKIDALDQKYYAGKHLLPIGVMNDAVWPFVWYLRDYSNVCLYYSDVNTCPWLGKTIPVIVSGGDNLPNTEAEYGNGKASKYLYHQYHMRTWWDEGYKPPPCIPSRQNDCSGEPAYGGVGPLLWLSYGDNPPPGAKFNPGLAAQHIWQWWWERRPIGSPDGSYDMALFIRTDLGMQP